MTPPNSFHTFCQVLEQISQTKKRLEIQSILTTHFTTLTESVQDLSAACYLATASFYPDHFGKELGVGETLILKVVSETTGRKVKAVRDEYKVTGDLGVIAMKYRVSSLVKIEGNLNTTDVLHLLRSISEEIGVKSVNVKVNMMLRSIIKTKGIETKYLVRLLEGKLKIGLALKTVQTALAMACSKSKKIFDDKSVVENVKFAYNQCPIFEDIVKLLLQHGSENINKYVKIKPGVPVKPMLAQPSKNLTSAYNRVENHDFTCEYKYDGERAQIHKFGDKYKVFSRNSEDLTEKYPDLKDVIHGISTSSDYILDAEVVAYNLEDKKILPFQILTTRKRKDVKIEDIKVRICVYVFDCLFYGDSLIEMQLCERRNILFKNFIQMEGKLHFVNYKDCKSVEDIDQVFNESINSNCEGLMIKNMDSLYKPSMRSTNWIKLKKDYLEGMSDSLDLVVIGCYYGKGKRTGTYGGFLLGCYDEQNSCYEAICKIGTGFDDETLQKVYNVLKDQIIDVPKNYVFNEQVKPDLWVEAKLVWEVKATGFSTSPIYSAGHRYNQNNGISLRFPRYVRERDDKKITDVTTSEQVLYMFKEFKTDKESSNDEFN